MYQTISFLCLLGSLSIATTVTLFDYPAGILIWGIVVLCTTYALVGKKRYKSNRLQIAFLLIFIYLASTLITSSCFSSNDYFLASDPTRYIAMAQGNRGYSTIIDEITRAYELTDNNGLYNAMLRLLGTWCNNMGIPATSLLLTLPQTLFGILTVQTVFRIISIKFTSQQATKYTLIYGICSLVLLYSGIIVRDIVIAFFFAVCTEVVLKPFKWKGVLLLLVMMTLCIGIRLFSGLFISIFIVYYFFFNIKSKLVKWAIYPIAGVVLVAVLGSAIMSNLIEQTSEEINSYSEWQGEEAASNDGFSAKLRSLPTGINYIALTLYSQMNPFPPYSVLHYMAIRSHSRIYGKRIR